MPILALDTETVKLITTTQIITSVYAVVKELIENALDANADNIEISLVDNGTWLIEVKDNGSGISKEDALYMCLPSYTSKISNFEDLDALQTFGFRGEALHALCAVADVTVITKTDNDMVGISYTMHYNGQIAKHESCHRSTGTTIQVKNLFKQIPVRRQMITNTKKASQAIKLLEILIQAFGICKPHVRIQFRVNNDLTFTKPSLSNIKEATSYILGRKIMSNVEWIEPNDIAFTLLLMLPSKKVQDLSEISCSGLQYIFTNNRPIKHKDLEKLVNNLILQYFKQESRKKMVFLIYIVLEPMDIDINLEPNKDIILFKNQNKILDTIDKCIRTFYGLQSVENVEQNTSDDTSACYEDYTINLNKNTADVEQPVHKKRKLHAQKEEAIQEDFLSKEPVLDNQNNVITNENEKISQDEQQNNQQNNEQHYRDVLALTSHIQPPILSDPDSDDDFPAAILFNDMQKETLSQLPVVDLGEDFDFIEKELEIRDLNTSADENKDNLSETQNKKVSLETWSKGHVIGLKGGTDVKSDIAIGRQLDNICDKNEISKLDGQRVDHKDLKFLKHVRSQVRRENPTLTTAQAAKKITEFWKQLSSEERGYYRDIAEEETKNEECEKDREKIETSKVDTKNKSRLLRLFEKMKNEKKEKSNMRTIVPWDINRNKIITRSDFENQHIIGRLTPNFWVATICEQMWIVDITKLIKGLKITTVNTNEIDAKKIEQLLKQWLIERDDMSVMHSIYEYNTRKD